MLRTPDLSKNFFVIMFLRGEGKRVQRVKLFAELEFFQKFRNELRYRDN